MTAMRLMLRIFSLPTMADPLRCAVVAMLIGLPGVAIAAGASPSQWNQPAEQLAEQVAAILGPGEARLTIRNLSTISSDEIPSIRKLLEQDLKAHGIQLSGAESANSLRVTLSENARERIWVAEVVEGAETQVAMVHVGASAAQTNKLAGGIMLRKQTLFTSSEPLLSVLQNSNELVALEPEQIVIYAQTADGWHEQKRVNIGQGRPLPRDPRGILLESTSGQGFEALLAGTRCRGSLSALTSETPAVECRESDDPWTLLESGSAGGTASMSAFYNAARNYFTGVITPNPGVDLPPFYSAALIPRAVGGAALLLGGIDQKVQMVDNGALRTVAGARDWGSDFAILQSSCGAGTQIIASGSGEAVADSLRAYELATWEAVPASAPLAMDGTVTALWNAPDLKSVLAVVRNATNQFEVDRVTALCN
jgi:hypothetical protein